MEKILAGGTNKNEIHLWDFASYTHINILKTHKHPVCALLFSPDNTVLASGDTGGGHLPVGIAQQNTSCYHTNHLLEDISVNWHFHLMERPLQVQVAQAIPLKLLVERYFFGIFHQNNRNKKQNIVRSESTVRIAIALFIPTSILDIPS